MRCTSPRTVGFYSDGKTICWSPQKYSKEYPPFQLPCGKCLSCRLENARQKAVRCVHEAQMYGDKNVFITLTYDDTHLKSDKLQYSDFQQFMKKLRTEVHDDYLKTRYPESTQEFRRASYRKLSREERTRISEKLSVGMFVAGEYGDRKKRPHWHAILFNWRPTDGLYKYTSDLGDHVYTSKILSNLWPQGASEYGSVTLKSAGYVARYASKKLSHGFDGSHDYEPIARTSSRHAIGKAWLEKYWRDIFQNGEMVLDGGIRTGIPRYYERWLQKQHREEWLKYITEVKPKIIAQAVAKEEKISLAEKKENFKNSALFGLHMKATIKKNKVREVILEQKFDKLKKFQKL